MKDAVALRNRVQCDADRAGSWIVHCLRFDLKLGAVNASLCYSRKADEDAEILSVLRMEREKARDSP